MQEIKLTKAQKTMLAAYANMSIWSKPAHAAERKTERVLIEAGYIKNWQITPAGKAAIGS